MKYELYVFDVETTGLTRSKMIQLKFLSIVFQRMNKKLGGY